MSDSARQTSPGLRSPLGLLAIAGFVVGVGLFNPLIGLVGATVVGISWTVFGPIPAVAVGQFVLAGLGTQPPVALVGLQAPLVALLASSLLENWYPSQQLLAAAVTALVVGAMAALAWLWVASLWVAALVTLFAFGIGLYGVHRYEIVSRARAASSATND